MYTNIPQIHTYIKKTNIYIQKTIVACSQIRASTQFLKENSTMFKLHIAQTMRLLGRKPKITTLVRLDASNSTAHRLLNGNTNGIKLTTLFKICELLNCTPNDLLDIPDKDFQNLPPNHPLRKLKKPTIQQSPIVLANNIPLDRFEEASKLLNDFLNPQTPETNNVVGESEKLEN